MATEIQGFLQTAPCLVDTNLTTDVFPTSTIGSAPTITGAVPSGSAQASGANWVSTGGALSTDYGGTSNPNSGVEYNITCTPATHNGLQPWVGVSGPFTAPLAGTLVLPYAINTQMVRFEVFGMYWDVVPSGTQCQQDSGIVWLQGGMGQGVIYDSSQTNNGGGNMGWGIVIDTATGKLMFVAKQVNGTGGAGLSAKVDLVTPANGLNKPFYVDMRWFSPTLTSAASIQIIIDTTDVTPLLTSVQSSWATSTILPSLNIGGSAKAAGFIPCIANNTPTLDTANPILHFAGARLRMGSIAACTLENQH